MKLTIYNPHEDYAETILTDTEGVEKNLGLKKGKRSIHS